jgi:hypothetical protein
LPTLVSQGLDEPSTLPAPGDKMSYKVEFKNARTRTIKMDLKKGIDTDPAMPADAPTPTVSTPLLQGLNNPPNLPALPPLQQVTSDVPRARRGAGIFVVAGEEETDEGKGESSCAPPPPFVIPAADVPANVPADVPAEVPASAAASSMPSKNVTGSTEKDSGANAFMPSKDTEKESVADLRQHKQKRKQWKTAVAKVEIDNVVKSGSEKGKASRTWNFFQDKANTFRRNSTLAGPKAEVSKELQEQNRRSQRNGRFHRARGLTCGAVHTGGGPDMEGFVEGDIADFHNDPLMQLFCTEPAFRFRGKLYPEVAMPAVAFEQGLLQTMEEFEAEEFAMVLADQEAERQAKINARRTAKKQKKRGRCKCLKARLPMWAKKPLLALCLLYCALMASITLTYAVKFALRAETAALEAGMRAMEGVNFTESNGTIIYFLPVWKAVETELLTVNQTLGLDPNSTIEVAKAVVNKTVTLPATALTALPATAATAVAIAAVAVTAVAGCYCPMPPDATDVAAFSAPELQ